MWGESSQNCENNCQCSGLITENFKINSGNNATKRKQETAFSNNYKIKMNPHSLDFQSPAHSPKATPSKRRILGEIQNFKTNSPLIGRLKSPMTSPVNSLNASFKSPLNLNPLNIKSPMVISPLTSLASPLLNSPIIASQSPLTSRLKRSSKITKIFEERTRFKMENKENESLSNSFNESCSEDKENYNNENYSEGLKEYSEQSYNFDLEETARDFSFGERFQASRERAENWSSSKLDFTDALPMKSYDQVPEPTQDMDDLESLHDLVEYENESFDRCTKYEIISTDSPNVISRGRSTSRKICSRNFEFGAPLAESEPSTSFNRPATRMLNFDDEDFEFTSPAVKKAAKKSLKFNETPTKVSLRHRSDSSIGSFSSMSSSPSKLSRIFTSESTASMESGFISELDEPFLDIEDSNSPKIANFNDLLSGQIRENIITDRNFLKRPTLARSLSFHPEMVSKRIVASPSEEKRKREAEIENSNKRRKSNCGSPMERVQRPVLHRAFSENDASIESALARSSDNSDLIGDFSGGFALPLTGGDHDDLKSISSETLAALLRGDYKDTVPEYQVIDCRYPYEFEGGHVRGALNLFTPEQVQAFVQRPSGRKVLVFHCEFSIERGPNLSRALRAFDRSHNQARYPSLAYPEVYLLHGGYRAFHRAHPSLCTPGGYTPMLDPQHKHLLRRHRSLQGRNRLLL